jgi:hypothetical protein
MAIFSKKKQEFVAFTPITEGLKGEVKVDNDITKIGEPHPFDYDITQGLYKDFGLITAVVDKLVDFVWGPGFYTVSNDQNAKTIIDNWIKDVNFDSVGRKWLRQALIKGFSPLELGGNESETVQGTKVLNANNVFVYRDKFGNIKEYRQLRSNKSGSRNDEFISFKPFQIAHLNIKELDDQAYGLGIIYPSLKLTNSLLGLQRDMNKLMERKANSPIIAYLGNAETGDLPDQESIDSFGSKLSYMSNTTEWAVGANIKVEALNFGNVGEKFSYPLDHYMNLLIYSFQTPEVLLGRGSIPEGLAAVQMDAYERMINSIQVEVEKIIENQIFSRVLKSNGLNVHVEFEWGQPSQEQTNNKIAQITSILQNSFLSMESRNAYELELADLMGIDINEVKTKNDLRQDQLNKQQPEVPKNEFFYEGSDIRKNWK